MPILSEVARKHPAQRLLRAGIYLLLTLGAIAIVYPLLIVLGQTISDKYDLRDNAIAPSYLYDRNELALKYVFAQYTTLDFLASRHNRDAWGNQMQMRDDAGFFANASEAFAKEGFNVEKADRPVADFREFIAAERTEFLVPRAFRIADYYSPFLKERYTKKAHEFLDDYKRTGALPEWFNRVVPEPGNNQQAVLDDINRLGVAIMNQELHGDYLNYDSVELRWQGNFIMPFWKPGSDPKDILWRDFVATLPSEMKMVVGADYYWHGFLRIKYRNAAAMNAAWGTSYAGFQELHAPLARPSSPAIAKDWDEFVVKRWPRSLIEVPASYSPAWREYLRKPLLANNANDGAKALAEASRLYGKAFGSWSEIEIPARRPSNEDLSRYWCAFTSSGSVPSSDFALNAPETRFRSFLQAKYSKAGGDALAALNAAWGSSFKSFDSIPLVSALEDFHTVSSQPGKVRWLFMTDSYCRVLEMLSGRGHAIQNTVILVVLSLLAALTINPIAAYSLSRFPMKSSQKIMIFLLATMAFPAEVSMIPNFLLLRDLGLLNTYAALIIPGIANGFAIFLLKGFFDSLPQELFEAAELDGASEIQIFRMVAMPLVKPILAYVGLGTFIAAYSGFMWAFVICPKQEMWTLMVWVYDFQMHNPGNNFIMAATVLVSIPPLIVFLFANRIIMQGIVIPSMK